MEDSSLSVQLKKNKTRDHKFFVYKDKKYPFDFNLFKENSNYFYKNRKHLKKVKEIKLLNEYEDDNIELSEEIIKTFISSCQNDIFEINKSNAIELQFLSMKYEVDELKSITHEYIENNHESLLMKSFLFKTRHLRTIKGSENINYDTSNEEEIISKHLYEYINDKELGLLPIETFDRILKKHLKNNNNEKKDKKDEKDKEDEMMKILFSYLDKYGGEASILFSNVDFSQQRIEVMTCLLDKYSNIFDFSMINSTLLKTTREMMSEMSKMRTEYSKNINEMKELFKTQRSEIEEVKQEYLNMKEEETKRTEERRIIFEQEVERMKDEMKRQRSEFESELQRMKNNMEEQRKEFEREVEVMKEKMKQQGTEFESELQRMKKKQEEILDTKKIAKYQEILRDTITNDEYQNMKEESKQYIFDEIIQNRNHNQEQEENTNQNKSIEKSIQKSPDCLSNRISCMIERKKVLRR